MAYSQSLTLLLRRAALLLMIAFLPTSCANTLGRAQQKPAHSPTPGSFKLFEGVDGVPSEVLAEQSPREDLNVRTVTGSSTPSEITSGETTELVISSKMRVSLSGDSKGQEGWSVNNLVLLEVLVEDKVIDRFGVGFFEPIYAGAEMIEAVGDYSPNFGPRSPTITHRLPLDTPFVVRATALDYRNLGSVTSLWLIIEESQEALDFKELRDD